jgi:hypothetical protein
MNISSLVTLVLLPLLPFRQQTVKEDTSQAPINGPAVVFFGPTKAEGDSLVQLSGLELADVFDEFDLAAGKVAVYAKNHGIPVQFTTSPMTLLKLPDKKIRAVDRRTIPEYVGMILADGVQEPRIVAGITDERRLYAEINEFFKLK